MRQCRLTIALGVIAVAEDDAIAAYVRFARTTLPKLEKAWAAPHRADPVTQSKRSRVLLPGGPGDAGVKWERRRGHGEAGPALHDGQGAP